MKTNQKQKKIKIISEIHPQHFGSVSEAERMILACKLGGADFVKVQLYSSQNLFNNNEREFLELTKKEFVHLHDYSKNIGIELFASIFDEERLEWCEELNIQNYKIASRTVEDLRLCEKIISTKKNIIFSLGMYDFKKNGKPFSNPNIKYLYCVSKYPTNLEDIEMPNFENNKIFIGYSDHTIGTTACIYAISKGAQIIEKHFSFNKSQNTTTQMAHVCSMNQSDLEEIRFHADNMTLIKSAEK